jgi:hypothetical protein
MAKDPIADLSSRLIAAMPHAAAEIQQISSEVRQGWARCSPYIPIRDPLEKLDSLSRALRQGQPLKQAFATAGVSQATGYRMLKRSSRPR